MQTTVQTPTQTQRSLALSYLGLRKCLGVLGILLPIVLAVGKMAIDNSPVLLDSLSAYYHSVMRDVWVGSLCAMGVFLFSYRYTLHDDVVADLAGLCAIGTALFPSAQAGATANQQLLDQLHSVFGVGLLLLMAYFALVLFRKTDRNKPSTRQKLQRNRVYLVCGLIILVCLALLGLIQFRLVPALNEALQGLQPSFWLESLAVWAFGLAWLVKGETLLKDK